MNKILGKHRDLVVHFCDSIYIFACNWSELIKKLVKVFILLTL